MTANEKEQMMIDDILDFMRLAGDIARGAQNHLDASANYLKAESVTSVVTRPIWKSANSSASLLPAVLLIRTM